MHVSKVEVLFLACIQIHNIISYQAINKQKYDQMIPNVFVITLQILHVHVKTVKNYQLKVKSAQTFTNPLCGHKLQSYREGCSYWTNDLQNAIYNYEVFPSPIHSETTTHETTATTAPSAATARR